MSSAAGNLKKVKRSPLPGNRVPFRGDVAPKLPQAELNSAAPVPATEDLLASMSHRLTTVERELQNTKKELVNKEGYISELEERLASRGDAGLLEEYCRGLQQQLKEMEEFLKDYGMVWVGGTKHTHNKVNFDLIIKHIQELNTMCGHTAITATATGATFKSVDVVPLMLYKNGLLMFKGPFRPYSHPATQQLLTDLADGYFPTELQPLYPDGVPIDCIDQRDRVYSEEVGGEVLGGRESTSSFLSRLPISVIRAGKVIDIRASVAQTLQGDEVHGLVTEEPLTPQHTTTLRVHAPDKTYVLKMLPIATIASVRQHIDKLRCASAGGYQLKSSFPPRTFDNPRQTLLELGLTPTANIFISYSECVVQHY